MEESLAAVVLVLHAIAIPLGFGRPGRESTALVFLSAQFSAIGLGVSVLV